MFPCKTPSRGNQIVTASVEEPSIECNTPVCDYEEPLSPILSNSKNSIARKKSKSKIKLSNKFSQCSSVASQDAVASSSKSTNSANLSENTTSETISNHQSFEQRLKKCKDLQRNKKFSYEIASKSLPISSKQLNNNVDASPICAKVTSSEPKTITYQNILSPNVKLNISFKTGAGTKVNLSERSVNQHSKIFHEIIDSAPEYLCYSENDISNDSNITLPEDNLNLDSSLSNSASNIVQTYVDKNVNQTHTASSSSSNKDLQLNVSDISQTKVIDSFNYTNHLNESKENVLTVRQDPSFKKSYNDNIKTYSKPVLTENLNILKSNNNFKTPIPNHVKENKSIVEITPDSKNASYSQISDTQMCWAAENAESLVELIDSQWTPSPLETVKTTPVQCCAWRLRDPRIAARAEREYEDFSSQETDAFFGNITLNSDGTLAPRNPDPDEGPCYGFTREESTASWKKVELCRNNVHKKVWILHKIDFEPRKRSNVVRRKISVAEAIAYKMKKLKKSGDSSTETSLEYCTAPEKLNTSDELLERFCKKIFGDESSGMTQQSETSNENLSYSFFTASGKSVNISQNSLKTVRNNTETFDKNSAPSNSILQENNDCNDDSRGLSIPKNIFKLHGIMKTTSRPKKRVSFCELRRTRFIDESGDIIFEEIDENCSPQIETDFPANQKNKNELFNKRKNICENDKSERADTIPDNLTTSNRHDYNFMSALGNQVGVSKAALDKVRKIFGDDDDDKLPDEETSYTFNSLPESQNVASCSSDDTTLSEFVRNTKFGFQSSTLKENMLEDKLKRRRNFIDHFDSGNSSHNHLEFELPTKKPRILSSCEGTDENSLEKQVQFELQTAAGSMVEMSNDVLKKSGNNPSGSDDSPRSNITNKNVINIWKNDKFNDKNILKYESKRGFLSKTGFEVDVPQSVLQKVMNILDIDNVATDDDNDATDDDNDVDDAEPQRSLNVSGLQSDLNNVRNMINDNSDVEESHCSSLDVAENKTNSGFTDASTSQANILPNKVKNIGDNYDDEESHHSSLDVPENEINSEFHDASTAQASVPQSDLNIISNIVDENEESRSRDEQGNEMCGVSATSTSEINMSEETSHIEEICNNVDEISESESQTNERGKSKYGSHLNFSFNNQQKKLSSPKTGIKTPSGIKVFMSKARLKNAGVILIDRSIKKNAPLTNNKDDGANVSFKVKINVVEVEDASRKTNSMCEKYSSVTDNEFPGFSTASGTKLNVSKEKLKKVKNLFKGIDTFDEKDIDTNESSGFSAVTESQIEIADKNSNKNNNHISRNNVAPDTRMEIVSTATDSNVKISQEASTNVGKSIDEKEVSNKENLATEPPLKHGNIKHATIPENHSRINKTSIEDNESEKEISFSTASGIKLNIPQVKSKKIKNIFKGIDHFDEKDIEENECEFSSATESEDKIDENMNKNSDSPVLKNNVTPIFISELGFSTAGGCKVKVSEEALKRVRNANEENKFSNVEKPNTFNTPMQNKLTDASTPKINGNYIERNEFEKEIYFSTASGIKLNIPKAKSKKIRNIFKGIDHFDEKDIENNECEFKTSDVSTATGLKEKVDENLNKQCNNPVLKNNFSPKTKTELGFYTAGGHKVKISEEALKLVRTANKENNFPNAEKSNTFNNPMQSNFAHASTSKNLSNLNENTVENNEKEIYFSTGSGVKINIPKANSKKMKNIFKGIDQFDEKDIEDNEDEFKKSDISTATGSKEKIDENLDKQNDSPILTNDFPPKLRFFTAAGSEVKIPEKALKIVRNVNETDSFSNAETSNIINTPMQNNFAHATLRENHSRTDENDYDSEKEIHFSTASGIKLNVPKAKSKKIRNIFEGIDHFDEKDIEDNESGLKSYISAITGPEFKINENLNKYNKNTSRNNIPPQTRMEISFSTAAGSKVEISEEALNTVKKVTENKLLNEEKSCTISTPKKDQFTNANTTENQSKILRPINSENIQKFVPNIVNKSNHQSLSSPPLNTKRQGSSPQITCNTTTPVMRNRSVGLRNSKKRSLGVSPCRQIDLSETSMKKAKLVFDNLDTPTKKESLNINNNHIQRTVSPFLNKQESTASSAVNNTPTTPINKSPLNTSLLQSNVTVKETNQILAATPRSLPKKPSPLKLDLTEATNAETSQPFVIREPAEYDVKKLKSSIQTEYDMLRLKMSVMETRMQMFSKHQDVIQSAPEEYRRQGPGHLFVQKTQNEHRKSLREFVNNCRPGKMTYLKCLNMNVTQSLLDISPANSTNLQFHVPWYRNERQTYPAVIRTEDGAVLIPNVQNYISVTEVEFAFNAMPGVDPTLIPYGWIPNHYRWIVWKLASMERNFPRLCMNCLSIENVMAQLKYRYDREIDRAERPTLRKILECDDTPAKRMVLCVATIIELAQGRYELELTDGWYSIKTVIDDPLNSLVSRGVIEIGMKLMIQGAELLNCEGCPPLEVPSNVRLKIHYNCTRRAAWDVRLGYYCNPGPLCISLRMTNANGGPVGRTRAYISRVYPISYMERANERTVWRNHKAEQHRANQWDSSKRQIMERLEIKVQEELQEEWRRERQQNEHKKMNSKNLLEITCPKILFRLLEDSNDPDGFMVSLTTRQCKSLTNYQCELQNQRHTEYASRLQEKLAKENFKQRDVTHVLKLLIVDVNSLYHYKTLNIWRPKEDHFQILKEGVVVDIYNVTPKTNASLSSNPRTHFEADLSYDCTKFEHLDRTIVPIAQTITSGFKPQFGEFDTVGIVASIDINETSQTLWLADADYRFLVVRIREGPESCALLEESSFGKVISISNLVYQKSSQTYSEAFANHYTVIVSYPQQEYIKTFMKDFIDCLPGNIEGYLENCKDKVEVFIAEKVARSMMLEPFAMESDSQTELLKNKLCGVESAPRDAISEGLTLSDEEMSLIDTQQL